MQCPDSARIIIQYASERLNSMSLLLIIIYLSFISLGLPDSLLGSAWPVMHKELSVSVSWSGVIFMIVSVGTVISSLLSDRLNRRFGTGKITAVSVAMTCAALLGNSVSHSFPLLCLWAIPYGLGAGGVDAALNNYVALHYASRHMSWLHCMWGVGAMTGPLVMRAVLSSGKNWTNGYRMIGLIQLILTAVLFSTLKLWNEDRMDDTRSSAAAMSPGELLGLPGAKEVMISFFCYCALEQTVGLWASTWMVSAKGFDPVSAAGFGSLFFIGITAGRAVSGFLTYRFNDKAMVRIGVGVILLGILLLLTSSSKLSIIGLVLIGLGCAPVYPCIIHSTPDHFGPERSQAIIGIQMASAYVGTSLMPPLFGWLSSRIGLGIFPFYLLLLLATMGLFHELLCVRARH